MPRFKYSAMDAKGTETEGVLDAESQSQAISMIRSKGFFPTAITAVTTPTTEKLPRAGRGAPAAVRPVTGERKTTRIFGRRVKARQLAVFTRQLATLVDAGLPLLRGLRILLKQEKTPALREALTGMGEAVESGSTFSEALAQYPKIFDKLFVSMVKAGEAGGVLEVVLKRLAEFSEKAERVKNKVRSAMVYPTVVIVAAIGILSFMLTTVIPKFEDIFRDLLEGQALPAVTRFVINTSRTVKNHALIVVAGITAFVILVRLWGRTKGGRYALDKFKLKLPLFGTLFTKAAVARFSRTLGTLMGSGVPVLQALQIVKETAGNEVIARAIDRVHDSVKEGETMAMPLEAAGVFPPMVVSMVDVGEETGALPEMLIKVADAYDDEVDTAIEGLTSILEPVMIVILAFIIGTIVISMFLPLISIIGKMSQ
ncbi:MAG: type II secretion system F family protein [Kiritimatiellae bacterium]|nr:type II secretion system F family protein [Kiritimatiellia bacterium]